MTRVVEFLSTGVLAASLWPGTLVAQATTMSGVVRAKSTGQPVPQAEVSIPGLGVSTHSGRDGRYRLTGIALGMHWLVVRAIGYQGIGDSVRVGADSTVSRDYVIAESAVPLDTVITAASATHFPSPKLRGFEERQKQGFGRFITEQDLRKSDDRRLVDLLRQIPGLRVIRDGRSNYVGSSRSQQIGLGAFGAIGGSRSPCYATVYVDGVLVYDLSMMNRSASSSASTPPNVDDYSVNSLMGVEFYSAEATLPQDFKSSGCGTLLLWTRDR